MTNTDLLSGQSVGTSTNIGSRLFASKTTLQTGTVGLFLEAALTNGAQGMNLNAPIRAWLAISAFSVTAAVATVQMAKSAVPFELNASADPAGVMQTLTEMQVNAGLYAYVWFEVPKLPVAGSLSVKLTEV